MIDILHCGRWQLSGQYHSGTVWVSVLLVPTHSLLSRVVYLPSPRQKRAPSNDPCIASSEEASPLWLTGGSPPDHQSRFRPPTQYFPGGGLEFYEVAGPAILYFVKNLYGRTFFYQSFSFLSNITVCIGCESCPSVRPPKLYLCLQLGLWYLVCDLSCCHCLRTPLCWSLFPLSDIIRGSRWKISRVPIQIGNIIFRRRKGQGHRARTWKDTEFAFSGQIITILMKPLETDLSAI